MAGKKVNCQLPGAELVAQGRTVEEAMVSIYALSHPETGEIRYIGKANDPGNRLKTHLSDSRRKKMPVSCWVAKLVSEGKSPVLSVIETVPYSGWGEAEIRLIAQYRKTHRLLNLADGGNAPQINIGVAAQNGRNTARRIHGNPVERRLWELKKNMGDSLKYLKKHDRKDAYNSVAAKLRKAAAKRPDLFGQWLALPEM